MRLLGYTFAAGCAAGFCAIIACILLSVRPTWSHLFSAPQWQPAAFVDPMNWASDTSWLYEETRYKRRAIFPSSFFTIAESFDELIDWVLRDFVASWYGNISSSPVFINEIDDAIRYTVIQLLDRLASLELAEVAVVRFVPLITRHLKDFHEAEQHVRGKRLNRNVTESEELDLAIAAKYRDGDLHPAASLAFADTKLIQSEHLRKLVSALLPKTLPTRLVESRAATALIRELVACAILHPVLQSLSDPDTWNQMLEAFGKTMLQDRKTVRKLRAALDTHTSPSSREHRHQRFPMIAPDDDDRKFERFVRAIRQCNNLSDARRLRNEISSQLKRESMLEGQDHVYLRRLETGKRILDQRVGMLSAAGGSSKDHSVNTAGDGIVVSRMANASISEMLHDASGLSYFMEYMDRLHLVTLVQFWIVVDGLRNPLEDDTFDESAFVDMSKQWTESDRLDIAQISQTYLTRPELKAPSPARHAVQEFLQAGRHATINQYYRARSAILRAQTTVQEDLQEQYLPGFRRSDLFYKLLASDTAAPNSDSRWRVKPNPGDEPSNSAGGTRRPAPSMPVSRANSELKASKTTVRSSSSTDLKSALFGDHEFPDTPRRSLDMRPASPLFDDDVQPDQRGSSRRSLDTGEYHVGQPISNQDDVVEAMEQALNSIMTDKSIHDEAKLPMPHVQGAAPYSGGDIVDTSSQHDGLERSETHDKRDRPNLASLGLVDASSRIGFFRDNDLFGEENFLEDERAGSGGESDGHDAGEEIHEAVPGDLGLAEAISALTTDIERLVAQDSIVDTLTRKAELTNNVAELRILTKSKSSLRREIQRKEMQKQQYIVQESDNSLFGRANIHIKSIMVGKEEDGQEFALYVIEVSRQAGEHMPLATWVVARRYSEFHRLHQRLRLVYPAVRNLDFPRRRLVMKLQNEFLHKRRVSLEHYLRELLRLPAVCRSRDLRAFLSQRPIVPKEDREDVDERTDMVSRIYNSVSEGMDEFLGNIPVLDQLSIAGQNLISNATSQYSSVVPSGDSTRLVAIDGIDPRQAQNELEAFDNQHLEPFVKPICDIFLEVFDLNRSSNWLRGRAVVVVLHQLLGGTVERKVRETTNAFIAEENLSKYLTIVKDAMWPNGVLQKERKQRTEAEKQASRREAGVVLAALVPELAGGVVGRTNAQTASRKLFATINNPRLNSHLVFKLLDEVVAVLYP